VTSEASDPDPIEQARRHRRHASQLAAPPGADDQRLPFQIDRDRILYCSAFRRLATVTQVVGSSEGFAFHNRLTHSMKVAQVARRLSECLRARYPQHAALLDPEVAEAAALAHDLGHPPFGHIAEKELDRCVRECPHGASDGYEGNAQTFRILTKLACHRPEYLGLDLTRATLRAVIKYPWTSSDARANAKGKWNAYESEREDFEHAMDGLHDRSLEAQVMELADDIAYSVHDIEDFVREGWVPLDRLLSDRSVEERARAAIVEVLAGTIKAADVAQAFGILRFAASDPLFVPYTGSRDQRAGLRLFTSRLIGRFIRSVRVEERGAALVAEMDRNCEVETKVLKCLMKHYVFSHHVLTGQQHGHRALIRGLFSTFADAAHGKNRVARGILSPSLCELLELEEQRAPGDKDAIRTRIAADAVASLGEREAVALFRRYQGIEGGSVRNAFTF
jgi:dGTPase